MGKEHSHEHFDSFLGDLNEHDMGAPKSNIKEKLSDKSSSKSPKREYAMVDFDIISDDLFEQLELLGIDENVIHSSPEFKLPNLKDFETKIKTTPKAAKMVLSQSPVLVSKQKKKIAVISSSD